MKFPPLYECSVCGEAVKVTPQGEGVEPIKTFSCGHDDAIICANRKVTLHGVGELNAVEQAFFSVKLTVRQFLSALTGRSI
jgi:hypothetical protein